MADLSGVQGTVDESVTLTGVGVHSGEPATLTIHPADADSGLIFLRTGLPDDRDREIKAVWSEISATALCTVLGDPKGAFVSTVEHLLAALRALGVDNALIEVDGPEVPIMDGSSSAFVEAIDSVGVRLQGRARKVMRVLKPVRVEMGDAFGELRPHAGTRFEASIDYADGAIGHQCFAVDLSAQTFRDEISRARTFGFLKDVEQLWANNFARGSSLENAVVIGDDGVMNPEGTRWSDEFVRHKVLDAIGDLALAGMAIEGCYRSHKGGHRLNFMMMQALFADPTAYEIVDAAPAPAKRDHVSAGSDVGLALAAAALRPVTN
ncbi:MAG: UDP-3-O-acyl-N-acetylglucosamine deacetylase [Devosiaceae bacterium]|nr:UDP-3-O-acyl-N-acetylglucosamine deacetylase [Devosiaceae bacterium MH13]